MKKQKLNNPNVLKFISRTGTATDEKNINSNKYNVKVYNLSFVKYLEFFVLNNYENEIF